MNTNGEESLNNVDEDLILQFLKATVEQQLYLLQQDLHEARALLPKKEKRELDEDTKISRIAKILKVTLDSHETRESRGSKD